MVTLVGPVPKEARVTFTNEDIFDKAARVTGPEIPKDFPEKYTENLQTIELFNPSIAWEIDEVVRWEKRHGLEVRDEPVAIFKDYLSRGHAIFAALVEHPKVPGGIDPARLVACSVVLQRGVIIWNPDPGKQTLFLRSYMHNSEGSGSFVNFVPRVGIQISFASEVIWFPLELTRIVEEPASYVVLDILTPKPVDVGRIPQPFRLEQTGVMEYQGKLYRVSRVTAKLAARQKWPDLRFKPY